MIVGDTATVGYIILTLSVLVFIGIRYVPWFADHRFLRFLIHIACVLFALHGHYMTYLRSEAVNLCMTVTVDDNGREVQGTSVWSVVNSYPYMISMLGPWIPMGPMGPITYSTRYYGDAVIVDLGDKGKLFALLRSVDDPYYTVKSLPTSIFDEHLDPKWPKFDHKLGEPTIFDRVNSLGVAGRIEYRPGDEELFARETKAGKRLASTVRPDGSRANYIFPPRLVMFRDIRDHKTLTVVDPTNLAAVFGAGVTLRSITAEPTRDARTHNGIETIIPELDPDVPNNSPNRYTDAQWRRLGWQGTFVGEP